MSERSNMEYYRTRAERERELARTSVDALVARIHMEMAERYEHIVESEQTERLSPVEQAGGR